MLNGKVIWTSGNIIAAVSNSLRNNIRREAGYRNIKWTLLEELPPDNLVDESLVWEKAEVNCSAKTVAISMLRVGVLEEKVMG